MYILYSLVTGKFHNGKFMLISSIWTTIQMFLGMVIPNDVLPFTAGISRHRNEAFAVGAGVTVPNQDFGLVGHAGGMIHTFSVVTSIVSMPVNSSESFNPVSVCDQSIGINCSDNSGAPVVSILGVLVVM